jgi:cytochrome c oxidase assembly protein subunit 15
MPIISSHKNHKSEFQPGLYAFCWLSLLAVLILLFAGGVTTSIKAGMAFLDWPLSNGSLNPEGWLSESDQFAEHSHRLLGMQIGILSLVLCIWVWLKDKRPSVRLCALALVGLVGFQGVLGGLRVLLDPLNGMDSVWISRAFAIAHACGGQLILCFWVYQVVAQSRWATRVNENGKSFAPAVGYWAFGVIFIQLILGAVMRHSDAGLAIPTFPKLPNGSWIPSVWSFPVGIHWAHRAWAIVVSIALVAWVVQLFRARPHFLKIFATLIALVLIAQIGLACMC